MNAQNIQITNSSKSHCILLKFTPPENADVPDSKSLITISPGSTETISVNGGVMNMFVWEKHSEDNIQSILVWKGIVPTKVNKTLVVDPKEGKVFYDGMELPSNFQPSTNLEQLGSRSSRSSSSGSGNMSVNWWTYFIVSFIIVLLIMGLFYGLWSKKYPSKRK